MPRPRPPRPTSQKSLQRKGAIIALILAAGSIATIGYFIYQGAQTPPPAPHSPVAEAPIGIEIRPGDALSADKAGGAENIDITLVDKDDPGRRTGRLIISVLDPDPEQQFVQNATEPQFWAYLKDGGAIHIRADKGRLYMPDRQSAPESGSISGNVIIRAFDPREDGRPHSLENTPAATFTTNSINFDSALGEAFSEDRFEFVRPGVAYLRATGFRIVMNEAQQRLERMHIAKGEELGVWQQDGRKNAKTAPAKPAQAAARPATPGTPAEPKPAAASEVPVETRYAMNFDGNVRVRHKTSEISSADDLFIWARLLDNQLPANAIKEVRFQESPTRSADAQPAPAPSPSPSPAPAPTPTQTIASAPVASPAPDLILNWDGPCTIDLAPAETPELRSNHLAMRFASQRPEGVRYTETQQNISGSAATIDYALTTARLRLAAADPAQSAGATLESKDRSLQVGTLEYDLSTGIAHIPTGGRLAQSESEFITWSRQADVEFELENGELTSNVRQASFQGDIHLESPEGLATADFARADFVPSPTGRGQSLSRALLEGSARIASHEGGYVKADTLDIPFALQGDNSNSFDPQAITATGNAEAARDGQSLAAQLIEANLARNPEGDIDISTILARGDVRFIDANDGINVAADELRGDLAWSSVRTAAGEFVRSQIVDLLGREVTLSKDDRTTIAGTQVRADGNARTLQVFGTGSFTHKDNRDKPVSIHANWSRGMTYDDVGGLIETDGDSIATATAEAGDQQTIRAERLKLWIEPENMRLPEGASLAFADGDRKLLKAEAIGGTLIREGGTNASIESRHILAGPTGEQQTAQLYYLEGPRILADNVAQTVRIPAAGRLLLLDQRPENAAEPRDNKPLAFGPASSRGTALMDWDGSLLMDRKSGAMDARDNVRLTHRALDEEGTITNLLAERVIARIREIAAGQSEAAGTGDGLRAQLLSATATGAVYVTSGPEITPDSPRPQTKELVADKVEYNAIDRTLTAAAAPGNQVSLFDPKHPVPATAASLFWDLTTDRVEIKQPGPISAPRSTSSR